MLTHPYVHEGQTVAMGQIIGIVGSSGHSSGPHLHFEVHVSGAPTDPTPFMMAMCAPLGITSGQRACWTQCSATEPSNATATRR
jgi:hypothetical protein